MSCTTDAARVPLHTVGVAEHEPDADDDEEQRDVDSAEQRPGVAVVDFALRVLDPVQAVDRRRYRVDQDPLRVLLDLW
jgi:hypothetical protein